MPTGFRRRDLLAALAAPSPQPGVRRELFRPSPGKGTAVMAYAYYTHPSGGAMMSIEQRWSRSDTVDAALIRHSRDYGRTWSQPVERTTGERRPEGMLRRHPRGGWIDRATGRFFEFWIEGLLPSDDPLEGLRQWNIFYTINGGPTHQVIAAGHEPRHPLPNVWTGRNAVMMGDHTCQPLTLRDGTILLPVSIGPLGPDGRLHNPGGGYTWHDSGVIRGRWQADRVAWEPGGMVQADPARSTRGFDEPTLAELADGRVLMVLRGSNDRNHALPCYKWAAFSADGGRSFTTPQPWAFADGTPFFSPSACSQLLAHSNGRLYWLGNITPENPKGNRPRYPFVLAEVDRRTGLLLRPTVRTIDTLAPGDDPLLTLSNFYAREDRQTREVAVHMTRLFALPDGWLGDAFLYRVRT